jgi:hypothetical protein
MLQLVILVDGLQTIFRAELLPQKTVNCNPGRK